VGARLIRCPSEEMLTNASGRHLLLARRRAIDDQNRVPDACRTLPQEKNTASRASIHYPFRAAPARRPHLGARICRARMRPHVPLRRHPIRTARPASLPPLLASALRYHPRGCCGRRCACVEVHHLTAEIALAAVDSSSQWATGESCAAGHARYRVHDGAKSGDRVAECSVRTTHRSSPASMCTWRKAY